MLVQTPLAIPGRVVLVASAARRRPERERPRGEADGEQAPGHALDASTVARASSDRVGARES